MKKYLSLLLFTVLACILITGCQGNEASGSGNNTGTQASSASESPAPESGGNQKETQLPSMSENIDVDLTQLSSTLVYAEVYNMMTNPDNYMGKIIKAAGVYYASYDPETGQYYHYVIVEDAAACCVQGLEFIWNGNHVFPDDYPENMTNIEVAGMFGSYEEDGITWYYLAIDKINYLE